MWGLDREQHTKILGFALLGYGISNFLTHIGSMWVYANAAGRMRETLGLEVQVFLPLLILTVSIWSSVLILDEHIRASLNLKSVFGSIAFVLVAITSFPVGTLLSAYLLLYISKIAENSSS
jgi:hypothetical protein